MEGRAHHQRMSFTNLYQGVFFSMYKVSNLHIFQLLHDPLLELCALIIGQEHVDSRVDPVTCGQKKGYGANRYRSDRSIRWQRARSEEFLGVIDRAERQRGACWRLG